MPNPEKGGLGGVFRNSNGDWILGYAQALTKVSNVQAELLAIREGLRIAVDNQVQHLVVETDSQIASDLLKTNLSNKLTFIVLDYRYLIQKISPVILQHSYGKGNKVANYLAASGRTLTSPLLKVWDREPPDRVCRKLICFDIGPATEVHFVKKGLG